MWLRILSLIFLIQLSLIGFVFAETISDEISWQGEVRLSEPVQVAKGAVLTLKAGTRVIVSDPQLTLTIQGRLLINGTAQAPVLFETARGWKGISFIEAESGSHIVQARFSDCEQALGVIATSPLIKESEFRGCKAAIKLLRESSAEIRDNRFDGNDLGLGIEMRSSPLVVGNSFYRHKKSGISASNSSRGQIEDNIFVDNEQGLSIIQKYPDLVRGNRFEQNRVGLYCYQTQNTPRIEGNTFLENEHALVNFSFSFPEVRNNLFQKNQTAVQNDQFGSALIERNLFEKNRTALYNNRKSNPKVRQNKFIENELAFFVDYSSYPLVKQNNFEKTGEGARLGIYQSADWEKRSGSKQLVMKNAMQRGSKNNLLQQAPESFTDIVDLSGNWWGEKNAQLGEADEEANLDFFYDRHDKEMVVYEGFGPDSYRLDEIRFLPLLQQPVAGAGPQ